MSDNGDTKPCNKCGAPSSIYQPDSSKISGLTGGSIGNSQLLSETLGKP